MTPKSFIAICFVAISTTCNAYESRACMAGMDSAFVASQGLENAVSDMDSTMAALLNSGVLTDNETEIHLSNSASKAMMSLTSSSVISILRQSGSFKQTGLVDGLVKQQFQGTFEMFKLAKNSFVKFTGSLTNSTLRAQAFKVSQELDNISIQIRACQK